MSSITALRPGLEYAPYPEHPAVGIGVVIWREGQLLIVQRRNPPCQGQWRLPGGRQNLGETIEDAAIREIHKVVGIDIVPIGVITTLDIIERDDWGRVEQHVTLVEMAAFWRGGEIRPSPEVIQANWVYPDELEKFCVCTETAGVVNLSILQGVH